MGTTVQQAREQVHEALLGRTRELRVRLDGAVTTGTTEITFDSVADIREGDWVTCEQEVWYVEAKIGDTKATVSRAERGSTAVNHSDDTWCFVNPRYFPHKITDALRDEFLNLPNDVFAVTTLAVAIAADTSTAELLVPSNTTFLRLLANHRDDDDLNLPHVPLEVVHDPLSNHFTTSGVGIRIQDGWVYKGAETVEVTFAHTFASTAWTDATDLVTTIFMTEPLIDAIKYGAMWRIQSTREFQRAQQSAQTSTRRAEENQPMFQSQVAVQYDVMRDRLIDQERERLISRWGVRFTA